MHYIKPRFVLPLLSLAFSTWAQAYQDLGDKISTSQFLSKDQYLVSPNKKYFAIMQGDGNFVVYRGSSPGNNLGWLWLTRTAGAESFFIMQGDGNLVLYRGTSPGNNQGLVWQTGPTGAGGQSQLKLANNGQLQVTGDEMVYWETPVDPYVVARQQCEVDAQSALVWDFAANDRGVSVSDAYVAEYGNYKQCLSNKGAAIDTTQWNTAVRNYCVNYFNTAVMGGIDDYSYLSSCFGNRGVSIPKLYLSEYVTLYSNLSTECSTTINKQACITDKKVGLDQAVAQDWPGASVTFNYSTNVMSFTGIPAAPAPSLTYTSNLALGRPTNSTMIDYYGIPSRAVDGNTGGNYANGSVTHTSTIATLYTSLEDAISGIIQDSIAGDPVNYPAWQVELKEDSPVTEVTLFNRTDCCSDRLSNFNVYTLDENQGLVEKQFFSGTVGKRQTIKFSGKNARFVRIQLTSNNNLSLAEVVVKANLAQGRLATQSSTAYDGNPQRAVDGQTNGNWGSSSVTHTDNKINGVAAPQWWKVQLDKTSAVGEVVVWNRTDCCSERLSDFYVELLNDQGTVVGSQFFGGAAATKTVAQFNGSAGRYVRVRLKNANYLSLAEVQVFAASGMAQ